MGAIYVNQVTYWLFAVGVLAIAYYYRRTALIALVTALGRNRYSTVSQVLRVPFHLPGKNVRPAKVVKQLTIVEEDPGGFTLWDSPRGKYWVPTESACYVPVVIAEMLRSTYGVGPQGVQAGDVVVDGGANVGMFAREAFALGAQKVLAFEPALDNLECLRRNFPAEIRDGRMIVIAKGLWHETTTVQFLIDTFNQSGNKVVEQENVDTGKVIEIPVTTIDEVKRELGLLHIDFIKMDIEGAERHALDGAAETLRRDRPRLAICMYHLEDDIDVLPRKILEYNDTYRVEPGMCLPDGSIWRLRPKVLFFR
jgi:FkbM family methyltransferase